MLTGDKFETAENIGMACRLITPDFKIFKMKSSADVDAVLLESTIC